MKYSKCITTLRLQTMRIPWKLVSHREYFDYVHHISTFIHVDELVLKSQTSNSINFQVLTNILISLKSLSSNLDGNVFFLPFLIIKASATRCSIEINFCYWLLLALIDMQ